MLCIPASKACSITDGEHAREKEAGEQQEYAADDVSDRRDEVVAHFFAINRVDAFHFDLSLLSGAGAGVRGIVGGQFQEDIFEAQIHAAQFVKRPAFADQLGGDVAAHILAFGGFDGQRDSSVGAGRFDAYAANAGNFLHRGAGGFFIGLHFDVDALAAF